MLKMETPKERFISLLRSTEAKGIEDLIAWLDDPHCDFFVAPASTRYHCAYEGGLVDHSLAVFDECNTPGQQNDNDQGCFVGEGT